MSDEDTDNYKGIARVTLNLNNEEKVALSRGVKNLKGTASTEEEAILSSIYEQLKDSDGSLTLNLCGEEAVELFVSIKYLQKTTNNKKEKNLSNIHDKLKEAIGSATL